jgi:HEXXH motif-containing protein
MTQEALARRIGVSEVSLNAWVNGRAAPRKKALAVIDALYDESLLISNDGALAVERFDGKGLARLDSDQLDQLLRGGSDSKSIELIKISQQRELLTRLQRVIDLCPPNAQSAVELLEVAKNQSPDKWLNAISYPHVAVWLSACQASLQLNGCIEYDEIAYLRALAVSVAWQCEVTDFNQRLNDGLRKVVLPGLGYCAPGVLAEARRVGVVSRRGRLTLVIDGKKFPLPEHWDDAGEYWTPLRSINVTHSNLTLDLKIDDVDPYGATNTSYGAFSAARRYQLPESEADKWKDTIAQAWLYLVDNHFEFAREISESLSLLVPIYDTEIQHSCSYRDGFGAIVTTPDWGIAATAQVLVEEVQSMKLKALHHLVPLHDVTDPTPRYLPLWTSIPQSFEMVIEYFYASAAAAELWKARYESSFGEDKFDADLKLAWRNAWAEGLADQLIDCGHLTPAGKRMTAAVVQRASSLALQATPKARNFSRRRFIDRRICLRVQNVDYPEDVIERLKRAWLGGLPCPASVALQYSFRADVEPTFGWKRRDQLARIRTAHPKQFSILLEDPASIASLWPGVTLADVHQVNGSYDKAIELYLDAIEEKPDNCEAWAGLANACAQAGNRYSNSLGRFPEVVLRLYVELKQDGNIDVQPLELAEWLSPLLLQLDDSSMKVEADQR